MKIQRVAAFAAGLAIAAAGLAYGTVWFLGERIIARKYETPPQNIMASSDPAIIAEGERLANIAGCLGCHGADMNGKLFGEAPYIYRSVTANIPRLASDY